MVVKDLLSKMLLLASAAECLCGIVFVYPGAILATSSEQLINYKRLIGDRRELGGVLGGCFDWAIDEECSFRLRRTL